MRPTPEGRLAAAHGWPRALRVSVSSPVTTDDVGRAGSKLPDSASMTRRHHLEGLQQGLAALAAALYRQAPVRDSQVLDEAVRHGASVARELEQARALGERCGERRGRDRDGDPRRPSRPNGPASPLKGCSSGIVIRRAWPSWRWWPRRSCSSWCDPRSPGKPDGTISSCRHCFVRCRLRGSSWTRHLPLALFLFGLPAAVLALADPYSALVVEDVTYPGRRISLMIDASDSMQTAFKAETLNTRNDVQPAFFTTVAAAERFVQLRRKGKYRDLMALVEFGNRAYVITPFTSDYDNLLLSMALIGDPVEFSLFPDSGTVIASALEESIEIFKAFNYLEASGNLMVIFTDGEDTTSIVHGRSLDDILKSAVDNHIPLFFVRTNYNKSFGEGIPDAKWQAAVEKTGGRYYIAKDESSLIAAVEDIDREAVGAIQSRQYTSQRARFPMFALLAAMFWIGAAGLKLSTPWFAKLP